MANALAKTVFLTAINLRKYWRTNFDCIRDIAVIGWLEYVASMDSGNMVDTPCRRCGKLAKIPISYDAPCGCPPPPRARRNPDYDPPLFNSAPLTTDVSVGSGDVSLHDRTGAVGERNLLYLVVAPVTCRPPPILVSPWSPGGRFVIFLSIRRYHYMQLKRLRKSIRAILRRNNLKR